MAPDEKKPPGHPEPRKVGPEEASKTGAAPDVPPPLDEEPEEARMLARPAPRPKRRPIRSGPDRGAQAAWVARLQARDESALAEVIAAYGERITAVVAGVLRDRSAVDDVVQATFTKAWFRIASFKGDASLYTWLYRVAVNAAKDYVKARSRRPLTPLDDTIAARIPADAPPTLEGLERRELRLRVRAAVASLPERYRTVLALRELEGLTYQQIAEVLDLSLGTVESRLFRARRRLQAVLASDTATRRGEGPASDEEMNP